MRQQFTNFVQSELNEIETRNLYTLFEFMLDSLADIGRILSEQDESELFGEIERQVEAEKRAAKLLAETVGGSK